MHKRAFIALGVIFLILFFISLALAEPAKAQKFKHLDKNKDGVIDKKELKMEKSLEHKQSSKVNTWWEKRADTNADGVLDSNELAAWKTLEKERIDLNNDGVIDAKERRLCWRHGRSRVNTELEQKYDTNSDGWLEPNEVKELLQDKYTLIKTHGQAKVDTETEAEYDTNKDGIIDVDEAQALKNDLD